MIFNNEKESTNNKYKFLTETKLVKSSSLSKLHRNLEIGKLDQSMNRSAKSRSRSGSYRHKKKKKNKRIKLLYLNKLCRRSNGEITKKNNFEYKFKVLLGKIFVKKQDLDELAKRKKLYSEQVKKIKIIKKTNSFKPKEDSAFDIIRKYSLKVLCTNRAIINNKKEKEKELFQKLEEIDKSNLNSAILETPHVEQKLKLTPVLKNLQFINNNCTPIIPTIKNYTSKSNLIKFEENIQTNIGFHNNSFNLSKNLELTNKNNQNNFSQKKEILNKMSPELLRLKSIYKRNNEKNDITNSLNDSNKNEIIKIGKSFDNANIKHIEISSDIKYQKKPKKERVDLCKDLHILYYAIGPGNASYLVKNCMYHRTNWKESYSYVSNLFNFKWQPVSQGIDFLRLGKYASVKQIVNHFENHSCISNKANLFINMMDYCEQRKISVFKYIPLTIIFDLNILENTNDEKVLKKLQKLRKFMDEDENKFIKKYEDIGNYFKEKEYIEEKKKKYEMSKENQNKKNKILYYVKEVDEDKSDDEFTNDNMDIKYPLYRNIFGKIKLNEKTETKFQNNLCVNIKERDRQKFIAKYTGSNTVVELPETHSSGKNIWIIKAINLNRGMCIKIVNNYKKMIQVLNKFRLGVNYDFTSKNIDNTDNNTSSNENKDKKDDFNPRAPIYICEKIIIQKYIERPLLYKGRKCDMRVWVLITQNLKVYFFKEGHLKTCSIPFDIESKDAYTHITNYSFQKYNECFQKYEKGNEVPFYDFQKFIDEQYPDKNYKLNINLYSQIKEIVAISMKSVKEQIDKNGNTYQFEIFGYDFMLDENFNLFLIEVNTNPGLEESSPWIQIIVPRMLDDALRLTIDQLFNPAYDFSKMYKKDKDENTFKIITNEFKEKVESENKYLKTEIELRNKFEKEKEVDNKIKRMNTKSFNINDLIKKLDKKPEINTELNKNDKYISPFPVPGYKNDENLWEFVCDLTSNDPLDEFLDKDKESEKCYTGIRYLFNKKKNGEN